MPIKAKVFAGARKQKIIEKEKDYFVIKVKEKPEKGLANKAVIKVLAKHFQVSENQIKLIKGAKLRNKIFKVQ